MVGPLPAKRGGPKNGQTYLAHWRSDRGPIFGDPIAREKSVIPCRNPKRTPFFMGKNFRPPSIPWQARMGSYRVLHKLAVLNQAHPNVRISLSHFLKQIKAVNSLCPRLRCSTYAVGRLGSQKLQNKDKKKDPARLGSNQPKG